MDLARLHLPFKLQKFYPEAVSLLKSEKMDQFEFTGPYYSAVFEEDETIHTFFELGASGILSSFCDCPLHDENEEACPHAAAILMYAFHGHTQPMHERFEASPWSVLCRHMCEALGHEDEEWSDEERCFSIVHGDFCWKAFSKNSSIDIESILRGHLPSMEDDSLFFSLLSEEELSLWRRGRPSKNLRYQLSLWSAWAKWMFLLQEKGKILNFSLENGKKSSLPYLIKFSTEDLSVEIEIDPSWWEDLAPCLNAWDSTLKTYGIPSIDEIYIYDQDKKTLSIERAVLRPSKDVEFLPTDIDGLLFAESTGFFLEAQDKKMKKSLKGTQIADFFHKHPEKFSQGLQNWHAELDPVEPQYQISFDRSWNLHIEITLSGYSLKGEKTALWQDLLFIEDKGFFLLKDLRFSALNTKIPAERVARFLEEEKYFLNQFEGFHLHLAQLSSEVGYRVDLKGGVQLFFKEDWSLKKKGHDFGDWVYLEGEGFFRKQSARLPQEIIETGYIPFEGVPAFFETHASFLKSISGFFTDACPIREETLSLHILSDGSFSLAPVLLMEEGFSQKDVILYGLWGYLQGQGFFKIPARCYLPAELRESRIIKKRDQPKFLEEEYFSVLPFLSEVDPELQYEEHIDLVLSSIEKWNEKERSPFYRVRLNYTTHRGPIDTLALKKALSKKKKWFSGPAGLIHIDKPRFYWLESLEESSFEGEEILLRPWEVLKIQAFDPPVIPETLPAPMKQKWEEVTGTPVYEPPVLKDLNAVLRHYQENGVRWLWHLYQEGMSALLCDDMGLGKTLQTIALMSAVYNTKENPRFLVIAPTSVLYHWIQKINEFFPKLRVHLYWGQKREIDPFVNGEAEVLLTSYGVWRQDRAKLSSYTFDLAVFDEVQIAKNHQNKLYVSLKNIRSSIRLGLTGTPIENRLRELKALFDLVMPGYMPPEERFRQLFLIPIEKEDAEDAKKTLLHLSRPFTLRRRKEDVLFDLPEKTEEKAYAFLSKEQQEMYNSLLQQSKAEFVGDDEGAKVSLIHLFALLTKLKQITNHPACYLNTPQDYKKYRSGKWDLFTELLEEAVGSGQKVVVFSHFLSMIDLFERFSEEQGWKFVTLKGSTRNRQEIIHQFNKDPETQLFFGSLHAAGLGIDLTSASVVIHYDRWWNAARERQGTDRVHRIGQKRGVQVFKLITKETLEEKIDAIIEKKAKLLEDIVQIDDHEVLKRLTREEIKGLLEEAHRVAQFEDEEE